MSSFFDEASLVMIPSGYKDQKVYSVKPLDGSGDLTFSRASNATRVGPDGLIEKVRTNLILQSNTFSTTWTNTTSTETSGQAGYDGTNNAWLLQKTNFNGRVEQTISASGVLTFSVYAKAGTDNFLFLRVDGGAGLHTAFFDLVNGTVGITALATGTITAAGNGYYRCSISFNDTITIARIYVADANGDTSGTSGNIYIQDSQLEQTDFGPTPYLATTTAPVSTGPVSGLPRLDYLNSSCPRLLLEPQRTNLALNSESVASDTNVGYSVTANNTASPDGYVNADRILEDTGTLHLIQKEFTVGSTTDTYSVSFFVKANGRTSGRIFYGLSGAPFSAVSAVFDLSAGTITAASGDNGATAGISKIENYGNGWYRVSVSGVMGTAGTHYVRIQDTNGGAAGDPTKGFYVYGFQAELGAYATSYIPTLGAAVTRLADDTLTTDLSAVLPQTAGTLFWEIDYTLGSSVTMLVANVGASDYTLLEIQASGLARGGVFQNSTLVQRFALAGVTSGTYKMAFAYQTNSFAFYINGTLVNSATSGSTASVDLSQISLDWNATDFTRVHQALLFKTRLTNAQLAELTTL